LASGLLDHPISDSGHTQRAHPPVRFGNLDPPHRRRNITLRRQQPPSKRHQLVLLVSGERGDALAVNPARPTISANRGPRPGQVGRIGDGFLQLAHTGEHLLSLSQPLPSPRGPGRAASPSQRLVPQLSRTPWCSLRGLVSVGSFATPHRPLGPAGCPPTYKRRVSGHYPALSTTTSRLTPRRASVCLSHTGYSVAYPTPTDPPTGPHLDNRPPLPGPDCRMRGLHGTLRGLPGSFRQPFRHSPPKSPHTAPTVTVVPRGAPAGHPVWLPHGGIIGFPVRGRVATP